MAPKRTPKSSLMVDAIVRTNVGRLQPLAVPQMLHPSSLHLVKQSRRERESLSVVSSNVDKIPGRSRLNVAMVINRPGLATKTDDDQ